MCHTILRVTYATNETQSIDVREADEVSNRIVDLQAKDTVNRIEVFTKTDDVVRTTEWKRK